MSGRVLADTGRLVTSDPNTLPPQATPGVDPPPGRHATHADNNFRLRMPDVAAYFSASLFFTDELTKGKVYSRLCIR